MEKTTLIIILSVIVIFCRGVLTTMTSNSQTRMNNDATSRKLFKTSQRDMTKSSLITHIQVISSNLERSTTLQDLNPTRKSTWQEVQILTQSTQMANISLQTPYIANYTKSLHLQASKVLSSPSILAQRTAVLTKSYLTTRLSFVSTKRKEENTSSSKQFNMTSTTQYNMTSTKQCNMTSTSQYNMTSTTQYNVTSTKQCNMTSTSQYNMTSTTQYNVTSTKKFNMTSTKQYNMTSSKQYNMTSTTQFNMTSTKQYKMTSSKQYKMTSSKQYKMTSTKQYNMTSTTQYNMTSTKQCKMTSSYSKYLTEKSLKSTLLMTSYIPSSALNLTTMMNSSSTSVQVNPSLMTSFVELTKSKKEIRTHRVATTAHQSSLFSTYIESHRSANVSLFLVNDSSTSFLLKTTTTFPMMLNSTSSLKELNSTKLVKSLRTIYQTSFFYITTSLNATVTPSKTIQLNTSTQKSNISIYTELITAHSNITIPQTASLVVPSYITNSTDEQYSRAIQTKSYYSTPVLNTTLLSTLFRTSISNISLPVVVSTFEVPRTSLKMYHQSLSTEVTKIFSTPTHSPSMSIIMSTNTTSRKNVTTSRTMREKSSTSSIIYQTERITSFPISFNSTTLLRTKPVNSTPSTTLLFDKSFLLLTSSVYRIQNSTSQSLTEWKDQSSQFLEKSMSSSLISSEPLSITLLNTSMVPSLTSILEISSVFTASKLIHGSTSYNISSNHTLITKSSANVSVPTIWSSLHFTSHSPLNGSFYSFISFLPSSSSHSSFSWSFFPPHFHTFQSIVLSSSSSFYPSSLSFIITPSLSYYFPPSSSQLLHSSLPPPFLSPSINFSYHSTPHSFSSSLSHSPFYSSLSNYSSILYSSQSTSYSTSHFFNQSSSHSSSIFFQSLPSYMLISSFTSLLHTSTSFISLLPSRFSSSLASSHHFNSSISFSLSSYYQNSSSFSSSFFLTSLSLNSSLPTLPLPVSSFPPSSSQDTSNISFHSSASSSFSSPHISSTSSFHSIKSSTSSHRTFFISSPVTQSTSVKFDQTSTSVAPTLQTSMKASQGIKTSLHTTPYWKETTKKQTHRTYETVSIISTSIYPTSYFSELLSQTVWVGPHVRVHRTIHGRHDSWCSIMFVLLMLFFVTSSILIAYAMKWKGIMMTRFHDTIEPDQHDDGNEVGDEDETLRQYIKLKENTHTIIQVKSRSESVENEVPTPKYAWGRVSKNSCRGDDERGEDNKGYDSGGEGCSSKDNTNNGKMYKFC